MRLATLCVPILLLLSLPAVAQHPWQRPSAPMKRADVEKLIGKRDAESLSKPRHVVWVWGYDGGHAPGSHDYTRVRNLFADLLPRVNGLTVETAFRFPTAEQFERADLVVMYLHLPELGEEHYELLDPYLARGGGLVAIHETMIQRPRPAGHRWADRIGLAWSEGESTWGALFTRLHVDTTHPVFANFPARLEVVDEFYWRLHASKRHPPTTLAEVPVGPPTSSRAPLPEDRLSRERFPVFWTTNVGKGRVFCSLPGHNTFTFLDPRFRIVLLRGMAWAMGEKPGPLMPLVFSGIEEDGMVGTTDDLRDFPNKPRSLTGEGFAANASADAVNRRTNARLGLAADDELPRVKHVIDTHIHLYDTRRPEGVPWPPKDDAVLYAPHLPADFAKAAKPAGVTAVVVVEASDRLEDNRWVLDLVKGNDLFVGLVGNVDPYREDFAEHVDRLRRDRRFVGVRARVKGRKIDYRDERVLASFVHLAERGLALDILMNGEGAATVREIDRVAKRVPKLRIVVNHILGFDPNGKRPSDEWIAAVKSLAANENVYCKISGLFQRSTKQPAPIDDLDYFDDVLDVLWEEFGSKRLVYGSNWPCTKNSGDYASYVRLVTRYFADKGDEANERYFWRNAVEAYGLPIE